MINQCIRWKTDESDYKDHNSFAGGHHTEQHAILALERCDHHRLHDHDHHGFDDHDYHDFDDEHDDDEHDEDVGDDYDQHCHT